MTHRTIPIGRRAYVVLRSGEVFIDTFLERRSKYTVYKNKGRVRNNEIKSMGIYREGTSDDLRRRSERYVDKALAIAKAKLPLKKRKELVEKVIRATIEASGGGKRPSTPKGSS